MTPDGRSTTRSRSGGGYRCVCQTAVAAIEAVRYTNERPPAYLRAAVLAAGLFTAGSIFRRTRSPTRFGSGPISVARCSPSS
jgi:hypothetical protein